jgi:hypothetical protein
MSDQEWKDSLLHPPVVRVDVDQNLEIKRPPEIDLRQVMAPPMPDQLQAELRAVQNDPQLAAELWQRINVENTAPNVPGTDQPPREEHTIAQMGMALYLLQTLHFQGKEGYEHLIREKATSSDEDDEDDEDLDSTEAQS